MNLQEVKRKIDVGYMDSKELHGILDWLIKQVEGQPEETESFIRLRLKHANYHLGLSAEDLEKIANGIEDDPQFYDKLDDFLVEYITDFGEDYGIKWMDKNYEKIEFSLGSSIEEAVNELLSYKEKGKLVYGKFNGVTLYSDTVSMDSAYQEITGKSKAEFVEHIS